jgi:hypothetical protein
MTYTCGVQYVDNAADEVDERGSVTVEGAVSAFREFPFLEQLDQARSLEAPTFPTVSFRCSDDDSVLSIWSLEPDEFEVYLESSDRKVTVSESDTTRIESTIRKFFTGARVDLFKILAERPGAVVVRPLLARLRDIFN